MKPGVNIGLRTGYLASLGKYFYVIDLDHKNLLSKVYQLVPTSAPIVSTGKGFHIYCLWNLEAKTRHFNGIDIIGNGYVVAPVSVHPSGKVYQFVRPISGLTQATVDPQNFKPLPIVHNAQPVDAQDVQRHTTKQFNFGSVPEGQRHNTLISYLGILFAQCFLEEEALSIITSWNKLNLPPLLQSEVDYTVRNCWESWDTKY